MYSNDCEKDVSAMAVKLLVTDLDGTLLRSGSPVSAGNCAAVQAAVRAGVTVTLATGRMFRAALPVAEALGVDVPIITYNGALIKRVSGEVLYRSCLPEATVAEVVRYCQAQGWYVQLYSNDELYYVENCAEARGYEAEQQIKGHAVGWDGLLAHTAGVCKLLSITRGRTETDARVAALNAAFGETLAAVRSNDRYAELLMPGVTKATALQQLAQLLGVELAEVMAIGDSDNDLPMLQAAGQAVAMGNAVPAVKAACAYETGRCEDDGVAQAIYRWVLQG